MREALYALCVIVRFGGLWVGVGSVLTGRYWLGIGRKSKPIDWTDADEE